MTFPFNCFDKGFTVTAYLPFETPVFVRGNTEPAQVHPLQCLAQF